MEVDGGDILKDEVTLPLDTVGGVGHFLDTSSVVLFQPVFVSSLSRASKSASKILSEINWLSPRMGLETITVTTDRLADESLAAVLDLIQPFG